MDKFDEVSNSIAAILEDYDNTELLSLYNQYAEDKFAEQLYDNAPDIMDDLLCDKTPSEIISMVVNGSYYDSDDYVMIDDFGNLLSCNSVDEVIDLTDISDWMLYHKNSYGDKQIEAIIKEYKEDEEE